MAWLRPPFVAQLGDVTFIVTESRDVYARALAVHAYPGRDGADLEDVGGEPQEVSLDGHVDGVAWYAKLILLDAAIKKEGLHALVHPQHGTLFGRVRRLEVTHRDDELNMARIRLEFVVGTARAWSFAVTTSTIAAAAALDSAVQDVTSALAAL